jgi:hypothetical protein
MLINNKGRRSEVALFKNQKLKVAFLATFEYCHRLPERN